MTVERIHDLYRLVNGNNKVQERFKFNMGQVPESRTGPGSRSRVSYTCPRMTDGRRVRRGRTEKVKRTDRMRYDNANSCVGRDGSLCGSEPVGVSRSMPFQRFFR
ncbi:hypothetical protein EVAR_96743_1 [Eumeta japonica]|uniref:Uncharacterized protein n=1 Tax=Eumeta variegata TaxID=151549 RepID=A0A4C1Y3V2_EUMVA|nr:hypothetical protein EVAR_96743_1 [Eumeta japonica]